MKSKLLFFAAVFVLQQAVVWGQNLTISSSGQTGTSGTNWSITGNTLNVAASGTANIHPDVISNHLNSVGNLTVVLPWQISVARQCSIDGTITYTGSATRTLTFLIANDIFMTSPNQSITATGSGALNVVLRAANSGGVSPDNGRISIRQNNTINTNGGHLWIGGGSVDVIWNGLTVGNHFARTWSDNVPGLWIENSTLNTNGGNVYLAGLSHNSSENSGVNYGVRMVDSDISSVSGNIEINGELRGRYQIGNGTRIESTTTTATSITTTTGSITISGKGYDNDPNDNGYRFGAVITGSSSTIKTIISSTSGNIQIEGNAYFTATVNDKEGLGIGGATEIISRSGNITIRGTNTLETSGHYCNSIRFDPRNESNSIRVGFDGTNSYTGNILIEGNSIYQRYLHSSAGSIAVQTTGTLTIQPTGNAFTFMRADDSDALTYDDDWNFGTTLGSFTLGKTTNNANISFSNNLTVAGPINILGGNVTVNANITSSANGDILIKGIGNSNPSISVNSGRTINKSAGSGTLTLQGHGRVTNSGTISATGSGLLNVVMWSDFDNSNNDGGVSQFGTISTNGGHVWLGGSNNNGGSYTRNGLTVGDGPSIGSSGYNANALDLFGPITTSNGHVLIWAANGTGNGFNGIATNNSGTINAGTGNVTLMSDYTGGTFPVTTSGLVSLVPNAGSYETAITLAGSVSSGNLIFNTSPYNGLRLNNINSVGGLTIGRTEELLSNGNPVVFSNSSNVTITATGMNVAGPISVYGGNIFTQQNLTSTQSGAAILLQATGYIDLSASRTIQTNNGNITLRSNSSGTAVVLPNSNTGAITLNSGSSLLSNGGNITLGGNFNGTKGAALYAASARVGGAPGILISNATLNAAGGNIDIYGRSSTSYDDGIRLQANISTTGAGSIGIYGDAFGGLLSGTPDIWFGGITFITNSSTIETENGNINVEGVLTNSQNNGTYALNFYRSVYTTGSNTRDIQIISKTGDIQITGDRGTTSAGGMGSSSWGDIYFGSPLDGTWTASGDLKISYSNFVGAGFKGFKVKTTGAVTYEPTAASFVNAQTFPYNSNYTVAENASSLTIGKISNTANITMAATTSVAGPITVYGGNININENLNTTAGSTLGNILLKGSADVILAANKSITTSGAPVILWANSDNEAANGSIALRNGSSIVTGSSSVAGGHVWLGGGSDGTTWNGLAVGSGYAVPGTSFTPSNGGGATQAGIYLERNSISSFGGNIKIAGDGAATSRGIVTYGNTVAINSGNGKIEMDGQVTSSAAGNRGGVLFGLHDNTVISTVNISSSATSGDAITINGVGRGTEDAIGLSGTLNITSSGGGNIVMNGNALGSGRSIVAGNYYHGVMNVFANSGNIVLNGNTKAVQVAAAVFNGLTTGPSKINIGQGGTIASSSSDVFITANNIALAAGGIAINASGQVTLEPASNSFASAITFPIANLSISNNISGLTIGKPSNTANITIGGTTSIAGAITAYGGSLAINENLSSSTGSTISLYGNTLSFGSGKTVNSANGQLIVAPQNPALTIGMAGATGDLSLPASYFSTNFTNGFSNIQIGSENQTGAISTNTFNLQDNMSLLTSGSLTLGGNPVLGANNMTLGKDITTVNVGTPANYFQTNGSGRVIRAIPSAASRLFPVGSTAYNPVNITNNGTANEQYGARIQDDVRLNGLSGDVLDSSLVDVTWDLSKESNLGSTNINMALSWYDNQENELNDVDYTLNYFDGSVWTIATGSSSTPTSDNGLKTMIHTGYTGTFSPFAVGPSASSALPVSLTSFAANCQNEKIVMHWTTASEYNASHYQLEKSRDGFAWLEVTQIEAAGTTNQTSHYSYEDDNMGALTYYRLVQLDVDGKQEIFGPISVNCEIDGNLLLVYPNPSSENFTLNIQTNQTFEQAVIEMVDISGRVVLTQTQDIQVGTTTLHIHTENVQIGTYVLRIKGEGDTFSPIRVVKM